MPTPPVHPQPHACPSLRTVGYCARVSITTLPMKAEVWQKGPHQVCQTDLKVETRILVVETWACYPVTQVSQSALLRLLYIQGPSGWGFLLFSQ